VESRVINRIDIVSIPVSDQDRAQAFYRDKLGFAELSDTMMGGGRRWVQLAPKGAATSVTLVTWFDSMPAGSLKGLVLNTDDIDAEIRELSGRGVEMSPLEIQPWARFVTLSDPDGNVLVLQQRS
jgi:catechol 2,3-dioxygenase-like lactoylglutathione lyase family enzyme